MPVFGDYTVLGEDNEQIQSSHDVADAMSDDDEGKV